MGNNLGADDVLLKLTLSDLTVPLPPLPQMGLRHLQSRDQTSLLPSHHLQALEAAFLRMKEKYLSVSVCPVKKSRWEVVRRIVMFGKGEWALLPTLTLKAESRLRAPNWAKSSIIRVSLMSEVWQAWFLTLKYQTAACLSALRLVLGVTQSRRLRCHQGMPLRGDGNGPLLPTALRRSLSGVLGRNVSFAQLLRPSGLACISGLEV